MSSKAGKSVVQKVSRQGEGYAVEVTIIPPSKANGGQSQFSLEMGGLPVPDRKLSCDTVGLIVGEYLVKLLFGQRSVIGEGYLTLLIVQMNFDSVQNFLRSMQPMEAGLARLEAENNFPRGQLTDIAGPIQSSAAVNASLVLSGFAGTEGCMDFYYASPFSVQSINLGNRLLVDPVVRVLVPTPLMAALVRALQDRSKAFPVPQTREVNHA